MYRDETVTHWIAALRGGDDDAARMLWSRYFEKLTRLARRHLGASPRRVADEEDVALSVFHYVCDRAERGELDGLSDRDELWRLLVTVTVHKVIDQQRHMKREKRGGGGVRGESVFINSEKLQQPAGLDRIAGDSPSPEFLAHVSEQHDRVLDQLADETLRKIVLCKLEGMNNEEIGSNLGITSRSVRRKVERIREIWQEELAE